MVNMSITQMGGNETVRKFYPQVTKDSPRDIFEMHDTDLEPINRDRGNKYMAYSLPHDEDVAVENFEQRFGYKPKEVFNVFDKILLVGPVEDNEDE